MDGAACRKDKSPYRKITSGGMRVEKMMGRRAADLTQSELCA